MNNLSFWNRLSDTQKGLVSVVLTHLVAVLLFFTVVPLAYQNSIADQENMVIAAKDSCAAKIDNGAKAIIQLAQVDVNTKSFLVKLFEAAAKDSTSELGKQVDDAYVQFVGGNTQPMFLLMSALSGTDITATAQTVQREISAQRSIMADCSVNLIGTQNELKKTLGFDAAGNVAKFPQKYFNLNLSIVPDSALLDNDRDGRVTVLDYRPPVDANVLNSFNTGEGIPSTNPYDNTSP